MNGNCGYQSKMNANDMLSFVKKKVRSFWVCQNLIERKKW